MKKITTFTFLLIISLCIANTSRIDWLLEINQDGTVHILQVQNVTGKDSTFISDALFYVPWQFDEATAFAYDLEGTREFAVNPLDQGNLVYVALSSPLAYGQSQIIALEYDSIMLTEKKGADWSLETTFSIVNTSKIVIKLPKDATLSYFNAKDTPHISMENNTLSVSWNIEEGELVPIILSWTFGKEDSGLLPTPTAKITEKAKPQATQTPKKPPVQKKESFSFIYIILLTVIGIFVIIFFKKSNKPSISKIETIKTVLDGREKKIVEFLEGKIKPVSQKDIADALKMPIATVSNVVSRLEERDILERNKVGRSSRVSIKENFK